MSKIPNKKHSDKELSQLRAQSAMQASNSPIVDTYNKKIASKITIGLGYSLPLVAPFWSILKSMSENSNYQMLDIYIMAIPIILGIIIALWIAIKRVLSRHNAAFIFIIASLCCFSVVSAVNSNDFLKSNIIALTSQDGELLDEETSEEEETESDTMTDEEREELKNALEELRRERQEVELEAVRKKVKAESLDK